MTLITKEQAIEVLTCARNRLTPETWIKRELGLQEAINKKLYEPEDQDEADFFVNNASQFCAIGAVVKCGIWDDVPGKLRAFSVYLGSHIDPKIQEDYMANHPMFAQYYIADFNDRAETTLSDIIAVFDRAIAAVPEEGLGE